MIDELEAKNKRLARVRKWLLIAIAPLALAVLIFGFKVVSMNTFAQNSLDSHSTENFTIAQQNSEKQKFANWFEPWKAYYNNGTNLISLGAYDDGVKDLETALSMVTSPAGQCDIRANLAIGYEGQGSSLITDKKFDEAQKLFDKSKKVIDDSDESCKDEEKNPETSESIEETQARLEETDTPPAEEEAAEQPDQEEIEEIQGQLDGSSQQRQEDESSNPDNTSGDFTPTTGTPIPDKEVVDKPW